jgi:uncharacterized protein with NAD-binding domain and iron-sulfur cluster
VSQKVIILGGGIAGLSAAHELVERGFEVEIFELLPIAGGKARSFPLPGSGVGGRRDLPGEHGFRFFPLFYRHVIDTMQRIPYGANGNVADNLVDTTRCQLARFGRHSVNLTARSPRSINDVRVFLDDFARFFGGDLGLSHDDIAFFASKIWQIVTSCRERRMNEYEKIGWWDFIGAEQRSPGYQKLLGQSVTRSLVAAKARTASAKTIGNIFVQLLFDIVVPGPSTDRVLNGPTNDVWIHPWVDYLKSKGVRYHVDSKVTAVTFDGERVRGATINRGGSVITAAGDYFIFAMPVEDVIDLITPAMVKADPGLAHLFTLDDITEWMNGIQFYLREDVPIAHGHTVYIDSPWALTSISQAQFWDHVDFSNLGDGAVKGIISVDISEWEQQGLNGKAAKDCTEEEIKAEVWEQLKRSLNFGDRVVLKDEQLHRFSLDPDIRIHGGLEGTTANEEPLLVNLVDTWKLRPEAMTRIPNLFLASDYVRTNTDLATMEGANEAARRAVNSILKATGSQAPPCEIWDLHEPEIFLPWRELDRIRYAQGLPWDDTLVRIGLSVAQIVDGAIVALERASEEHAVMDSSGNSFAAIPLRVASALNRNAPGGGIPDLRRDATSVIERLTQIVALRLAEWQPSAREAHLTSPAAANPPRRPLPARTTTDGQRPGRVQILPG